MSGNYERTRIPKLPRGRASRFHGENGHSNGRGDGYQSNGHSSTHRGGGYSNGYEEYRSDNSRDRGGPSREEYRPRYSREDSRPGSSREEYRGGQQREGGFSREEYGARPSREGGPSRGQYRGSSRGQYRGGSSREDRYGGDRREASTSQSFQQIEYPTEPNKGENKRKRDEGEDTERKPPQKFSSRGGMRPGRGGGRRQQTKDYDNIKTKPKDLPTKQGVSGQVVKLKANYFRLTKKPNFSMIQYSVNFDPEVETTPIKKTLLRQISRNFGGYLYDGNNLYLTIQIPENPATYTVTDIHEQSYTITIRKTNEIQMTDDTAFQVLNIILRETMRGLNLQLIGRNFYDPNSMKEVSDLRIQLWPGYLTSIRQHEQDILLCAEIAYKVMRKETVYDILRSCVSRNPRGYQEEFSRRVIGTTVLTDYNNKTYKISDIDYDQQASSTFDTRSGPISYVDYYQRRYNINIRDPKQPILVSQPSMRDIRAGRAELICLIPELCRSTGLTDDMRKDFQKMRTLSNITRLNPANRIDRCRGFSDRIHKTGDSMNALSRFNLDFDKNLVEFTGRRIKEQKIYFGNKQFETKNSWENEFRNKKMYTSAILKNWIAIYPQYIERECEEFIDMMRQCGRKMGFNIENPRKEALRGDRPGDYVNAIQRCSDPEFVFCIIPRNQSDVYAAIKKECGVNRALCSQVLVQKTMGRNQMSVATKVAIQINSKLGGIPWMIKIPLQKLMTVGYDVTHDSANKRKSYGALVATMDLHTNIKYKFFSTVTEHMTGSDLSNNLSVSFLKALKAFRGIHGDFPERIVFYRDGVSDGQIENVMQNEVQAIQELFKKFYLEDKMPQFCFIVLNKKTHTRIFEGNQNPQPGTVVDDTITMPERYDFYLVSTQERQSTVSPTYYNVVYSNLQQKPDEIQELTYRFCHFYFNWNGTIRVPFVCQYAHKLSFLVGQFIHRELNSGLSEKLHFL